jgi:acetyl-CoA/propionyl-CoA carboxylase biotin carboxyl carrier protein
MLRALDEFEIEGVTTLMPFHKAIMASEQWANAETCRDLIEDKDWLKSLAPKDPAPPSKDDDEDDAETEERSYTVEVSGKRFEVKVHGEAFAPAGGGAPAANGARKAPKRSERKSGGGGGGDELTSPLQGNMWKVLVAKGDEVEEGQLVCIIEAMKMENEITAHKAGTIAELAVKEGEPISSGALIATITASEAPADDDEDDEG